MRIAFDAKRLFHNFTGLGNYSRTLVQNLLLFYPEIAVQLYTPRLKIHAETTFFLEHDRIDSYTSASRAKAYWRTFGIKKDIKQNQAQLYHGLSHEIPIGIQKIGIPSLVTIHDLIFRYYPEQFSFLDRKIYDWKFRYACENADAVVAISESTKQDIIDFYGISPNKIQVIYQTCATHFKQNYPESSRKAVLDKYGLPNDFLLYVGSIIPRKNLLDIVEALAVLPSDLQLPLVVVGSGKAYKQEVLARIQALRLEKLVFFPKISYQELPLLYQQARIFIYPSIYEGFGIPIIEALYSQTPVITCNTSSLPEAGGAGAYYIEPNNVEQLAAAIEVLLSDQKCYNALREEGKVHLHKFESAHLSQKLFTLYETLING